MCLELKVDAVPLQQEKMEDPTLAARKAELLAVLDASVNEKSDHCLLDEHAQDFSAKESDFNAKMPLQNGQSNGIDSVRSEAVENNPGGTVNCFDVNYNFSTPLLALSYENVFKTPESNFTKGCKWSPDGSCLLVGSDDKKMRLFNLPTPVACGDIQDERWYMQESITHSQPAVTIAEGELIYDYTWYPAMRSDDPQSCCFAVTCRDLPVHLWDAWNGNLICSYQPFDHLDQLVAPHSISFSLDGSLLLCGFNRCIRMFRTSRPGRYFEAIEAKDQPGIISCMAFNPMLPSVFVAGSYLGNLGLYSTDKNSLFCRIEGCPGGITQVQFSADGTKLYSGARKDNELLCWDVRNVGNILWSFKREVTTHQRIYFDLEPQLNRYIVSGTTSGTVLKWDLEDLGFSDDNKKPITVKSSSSFVAHKDCCNGISINPHYPVLATSSGQRHFPEPQSLSDADSSAEEDDRPLFICRNNNQENSVKLWWLGKQ